MTTQRKLLRELVSHDGLKDSLTGLLAFPAFMESAKRELRTAERNKTNVNLFLVSITETNGAGQKEHIARVEREIAERSDDELYDLSARILEISHAIKIHLRANDLVTRYTFAEFLIMNSGETFEITKKLSEVVGILGAAVIGFEIVKSDSKISELNSGLNLNNPSNDSLGRTTHKFSLETAIATLETEMAALIDSGANVSE